ncbi:alanine--tRNA ligase [Candidatus Nomurabacteria bacterium]|nr:alanine--tRNA ligase [Candidatus Nomurabacteria bacterium]
MDSNEIRKRFLAFFEKRGHAIIPSASLLPENDPSVLFNTAGMQPLVPYLMGQKHPQGTRLANFQKCVRTGDIDEVGDNTHLTFFEMMGNWSLGDYFKEEAIQWSFELLTSKEEGFGLDPSRLYITCFEGDDNAPKDEESATIWTKIFEKEGLNAEERIFFLPAESNWWSPGDNGPCGPDTEMFYDLTKEGLNIKNKEDFLKADDSQEVVEIWNDVFMEYKKENGKVVGKLENKNVDTGSGFERVTTVLQGKQSIFETDLFVPILEKIKELSSDYKEKEARIIADHIRAASFMISDGALPSNTDQGYVLRRLLRRAIRFADNIGMPENALLQLMPVIIDKYGSHYTNLNIENISNIIGDEENKFRKTLKEGLKETKDYVMKAEKGDFKVIPGKVAFKLFSTFGFPLELTKEIANESGVDVDEKEFNEEFEKHQEQSRTASAGKFKGGLAGHGEMETKYHTATHLLHAALREVLGEHVFQKGSNITAERLRFDFSHPDKMTDEEKTKVEDWINEKIDMGLSVTRQEMSFDEAKGLGAMGLFEDKYGDKVSVYSIGNEPNEICSRELCGGPHVVSIKDLGKFKIKKEEATSAGVRRIKAVLEE